MLQALLNHIRRELFFAQNKKRTKELLAYFLVDLNALQFEDILDHIISIWIFNESLGVLSYLESQRDLLFRVCAIDAFLHYAATMLVAGDLLALLDHCIVYKLVELRLPSLQNLLNYVISINVFSQLPHSILKI